jgi:hypothetical protein
MAPTKTPPTPLLSAQPLLRDVCTKCGKHWMTPYYTIFSICINKSCAAQGTYQGHHQHKSWHSVKNSLHTLACYLAYLGSPSYVDLVEKVSAMRGNEKYTLLKRAVMCPSDFEILRRISWHGWSCPSCDFQLCFPHPEEYLLKLIDNQPTRQFCEVEVEYPGNLWITKSEERDKNGYNETRLSIDGQREVVPACPQQGKNQETAGADDMWR